MHSQRLGNYFANLALSFLANKEKNKYSILKHIYGIWEYGTVEPICMEGMETQRMDV